MADYEVFDLWDIESKRRNKERERLEYERYFEDLRRELERVGTYNLLVNSTKC